MSQGTIIFAGENDDTEVQYEMVEIVMKICRLERVWMLYL